MTQFAKILVEFKNDNQVLWLYLNTPKANVLDKATMTELSTAIEAGTKNAALKCIVFEGTGAHFSFGASVPEHTSENAAGMLEAFGKLFYQLIDSKKPLVSVVRGMCLGGGMELATFCNWLFAAEDAKLGQPEIQLAVFPPVASLLLPYLAGQSVADDLCVTGRTITAAEAKEHGLVYDVSADPKAAAQKFIETHLLPKSAKSLEYALAASRFQFFENFKRDLKRLEEMYVMDLMATHDANEGIAAFLEKRKPAWKNA